ncbi:MAG: hypothetical protein CO143_02795 [Candidatus Moranbacteria bacterium CG_4_9_14_3_um_filter_45_14]|nr:MAG: hypothetical protein CO143_02795 [Candidatus Moranbacteria bacterium CG_4_9_14_3_um_filter_45_14]
MNTLDNTSLLFHCQAKPKNGSRKPLYYKIYPLFFGRIKIFFACFSEKFSTSKSVLNSSPKMGDRTESIPHEMKFVKSIILRIMLKIGKFLKFLKKLISRGKHPFTKPQHI